MHTSTQTVDGAISHAIRQRLGTAPLGTSHAVKEALAEAGFVIIPKPAVEATYVLTPEGEAIIRDLIETTPMTQADVTAAGDALEKDFDADEARYIYSVSGRDHAVDPRALAVRDVIEANRLLGMAVATLGHEAVDTLMRALPEPVLGAAAA